MPVIKHIQPGASRKVAEGEWPQHLLDSLPDSIILTDARHRVLAVNSRALALTGKTAASAIDRPVSSLFKLQYAATGARVDINSLLLRAQSTGKPAHAERCVIVSRASRVEVTVSALPVYSKPGNCQSAALVMKEPAREAKPAQLRDAILSMVSHELRTPLLHIKGFVSSLLESDIQWDEETKLDFLRTIDREADRLTAMVDGLMEISRMGTGELPLRLEPADPYQLAYAALDEASPFLRRHRTLVTVPENLPKVRIDALRVMGVLVNLIENASKYSEEGSVITLGAEEKSGEIVFSVTDRGIGVPAGITETIFEMFYRGDHGGKQSSGTGMGLAVCKAVVEAHRGKIWVESKEGGGSTFYFTLPVAGARHAGKPAKARQRAGKRLASAKAAAGSD